MNIPAFDTYKAVQTLKEAGFEEAQATAVVSTIGAAAGEDVAALREDVATLREDVAALSISVDGALKEQWAKLEEKLKDYPTKTDLADALKGQWIRFEEKLKDHPTKTELEKALEPFATGVELAALETRLTRYMTTLALASTGVTITVISLVIAIVQVLWGAGR